MPKLKPGGKDLLIGKSPFFGSKTKIFVWTVSCAGTQILGVIGLVMVRRAYLELVN